MRPSGVEGPYEFESFGRAALNSGPLAPQAKNINHIQAALHENKRVVVTRFGRQMDARAVCRLFRTPRGLRQTAVSHTEIAAALLESAKADGYAVIGNCGGT